MGSAGRSCAIGEAVLISFLLLFTSLHVQQSRAEYDGYSTVGQSDTSNGNNGGNNGDNNGGGNGDSNGGASGSGSGSGSVSEKAKNVWAATLLGTNVVPGPGDDLGTGTVEIQFQGNNRICYVLMLRKLRGDIESAGVYGNSKGKTGPLVIDFGQVNLSPLNSYKTQSVDVIVTKAKNDPGLRLNGSLTYTANACITVTSRDAPRILLDIRTNSVDYYVQINTISYVRGAVRGQLYRGAARNIGNVNTNTIEGPAYVSRNSAVGGKSMMTRPIDRFSWVRYVLSVIGAGALTSIFILAF